jgi:hypothetical protein
VIKQRTVLVLGAGASAPYGLPLGSELVDRIWGGVFGRSLPNGGAQGVEKEFIERLATFGPDVDHVRAFAKALQGSRTYSIDAFLETNRSPSFLEIGKAAIADVLLRAERMPSLENARPQDDWYRYLLNAIVQRDVAHFVKQARLLKVITFNFDRSLERALVSTLQHRFGISEAKASEHARVLRIHHVHGSLGAPQWMYEDHEDATPYGSNHHHAEFIDTVRKAASAIRIVHEEIPPSSERDDWLSQAEFVYFLGFGFEDRNLARLRIPEVLDPPTPVVVRATSLGKTALEMAPVVRRFERIPIRYAEEDTLTFLKNRAEALFQ